VDRIRPQLPHALEIEDDVRSSDRDGAGPAGADRSGRPFYHCPEPSSVVGHAREKSEANMAVLCALFVLTMLQTPMIAAGVRMGVYELVAALAAGGMGEVYRARDTRLGRDVALKVLSADFAATSASLARFEEEARHVAALNHPNIVALFDIGTAHGMAYIVTELVDGVTLRGAIFPVRKVADIGAQIADALAAAHGTGVTHRDVKPDNVMVTREGRVKVLDFGVAKVTGPRAADGMTVAQTGIGSIVGTAGYMAPEQVRGDAVDPRADIFAVGAVLYELLARVPAFAGATAAEIMTATLRVDPAELPSEVPNPFRQIVGRCLEKNPEERFQSARDLAFALRQLTGSPVTPSDPVTLQDRRLQSRIWIAGAGVLLGVLVTGLTAQRWAAEQDTTLDPIRLTRATADRRNELAPAFSPDGRSLAYLRVAGIRTELLVRPLDSIEPIRLGASNTALAAPVWSPDGNQICYTDVARELFCVGAAGGSPRRILEDVFAPQIAPDGSTIVFIRALETRPWLLRGTFAGSEPERIGDVPLASDVALLSPVSPDGSSVIVAANSGRWLISLSDGTRRELMSEEGVRTRSIAWLPDSRHIVAAEETTTLIGSRLSIQDTRSAARRLILRTADPIDAIAASADGTRIVYSAGPVERDVVEYSAEGTFVRTIAASSMLEGFPSWAPAGDRFVYRVGGPGQSDSLWLGTRDSASVTLVQRFTSNAASQTHISPDGERIAYADSTGIHVVSVSGGRAIRVLSSVSIGNAVCWSPNGEWIWYSEGPARLGRVPSAGGEPVIVESTAGILLDCSPDGRWLVRRGTSEFVLTGTDGKGERVVASSSAYATRSDNSAQFSERGKRLYLLGLDRRTLDVLDVDTGRKLRTITFGIPPEDQIEGFAFSADGTRVLLTTGGDRNDLWIAEGFAQPARSWSRWFRHWESPARVAPAR
jgi:serine/threonine protein kinase/Tol biopolymer transport system component